MCILFIRGKEVRNREKRPHIKDVDNQISAVDLNKDTDIKDSHDEVRNDSYTVSFSFFGFCGRPIQSVKDVLTE